MNLHVEGDAGCEGSQTVQRTSIFLIVEEGTTGGPADTKPREDAPSCNVRNLLIFSSVNME